VLAVLAIGILIAASFWIVRPFLIAGVWATMIVVATWPFMLAVQKRLWGRRAHIRGACARFLHYLDSSVTRRPYSSSAEIDLKKAEPKIWHRQL